MAQVVAKYVPNNASMARFLLSKRVEAVSKEAAGDIADVASGIASRYSRTGHLAESYKTDTTVGGAELEGGPRKVGVVYNTAPYAPAEELGKQLADGSRRQPRPSLRTAGELFHVPRGVRR